MESQYTLCCDPLHLPPETYKSFFCFNEYQLHASILPKLLRAQYRDKNKTKQQNEKLSK